MSRVELGKLYDPSQVESKWYRYWEERGYFKPPAETAGKSFTVLIPPPNVTGILTVGHVLNNTIQDILIRRARMQGRRTLWLPGTDHASIATEAKIVGQLGEEGLGKQTVGRAEFLERAWEWARRYGGTILEQLKRLGCSCDWSRTTFTMDDAYSNAVMEVFNRLYEDGLIYRGERLINWDPAGQTALSDEEVIYKETAGHLWYFRYPVKGSDAAVVVATTRPETMLGDTGVAVNPEDDRYRHLVGKTVILPLVGREIPIFADSFVDPEFGTGAVKVTPAHDPNDYLLGQSHELELVNILNPDGSLNDNTPDIFTGLDRFAARAAVVTEMERIRHLEKIEEHLHNVGYSERTDAMVEPYLSRQWFVRMDDLAANAQAAVDAGRVKFHPARWVKVYDHWLDNIHDWCISRQLWWGHRIPAWYGPDETIFVAHSEEEAAIKALEHYGKQVELHQDPDVLDTWFSSWLWPLATLGWPDEDHEDLQQFYPTQDLVTGPDIIFFWVARMIMAGLYLKGDVPFEDVYFTGMVRDKLGRKMSKSLGNSPDPIDLIEEYGADAVRMGMMLIAPQGQDILFSVDNVALGRNFMNKLWNAARFLMMNLEHPLPGSLDAVPDEKLETADRWILSRLNGTVSVVERAYRRYRINEVAKAMYDFVWGDYCDWYLEIIKARLYGDDGDSRNSARIVAVAVLKDILRLIHPYAPFISEEIWQHVKAGDEPDLIVAPFPEVAPERMSKEYEDEFRLLQEVITAVRSIRAEMDIGPAKKADLMVRGPSTAITALMNEQIHLERLAKVANFTAATDLKKPPHSATAVVAELEIFIPLEGLIDLDIERGRLKKRVADMEGRLSAVTKKLGNENFVKRAPESVVARERVKQKEYTDRLKKLQDNYQALI